MAVILAPKLANIFHDLIAAGSFPALWKTANITPIPKCSSPSQFPLDYRLSQKHLLFLRSMKIYISKIV